MSFVTCKRILTTLLILIFGKFSQAQNPLLFEDKFKSDNGKWFPYIDKPESFIFKNNTLTIQDERVRSMFQEIPLDDRYDFAVEMEFSFSAKNSEEIVTIGFRDDVQPYRSSLIFLVNGNSGFTINSGTETVVKKVYQPFKSFSGVDLTAKTVLRVERIGKFTTMKVNGILLSTVENINYPGYALGFNGGRGKVTFYRYSVYQNNSGINLPKELNANLKREYLPTTINNGMDATSIQLSPDGKTMYVNKRDFEDKEHPELLGCDDIYFSDKRKDGTWNPLQKMPAPINGIENNDIINISADNNTILFADTSCRPSKNIFYYTRYKTKTGWSELKKMEMLEAYNLSSYSNSIVSSNGKTIIIACTMEDSKGQCDMYVSHLMKDSSWSKPKRMPSGVNTLGIDLPCYIAPDNKTFYFATDGKIGYGEMDIYVTRRLDESWLYWSEPENLGPTINSSAWDCYYTMDAQGEYAYYTSNGDDKKIPNGFYRIKLSKAIKPSPVVMVKGKVLNAKTNLPIEALLYYEILPEGTEVGVARSNPRTGEYKLVLPYGKQYGYRAEAKGFITVNENFDLIEEKEYIEFENNLLLVPIEVGQTFKLNNIFFVQSKSELLTSSYPELNRLATILKENPTISIELRGYTDNIGDPQKNILLSEERVNVVRAYLINRGIAAGRITGKGLGGVNPVTTDTSEEARKLNRRVEFVILSK